MGQLTPVAQSAGRDEDRADKPETWSAKCDTCLLAVNGGLRSNSHAVLKSGDDSRERPA